MSVVNGLNRSSGTSSPSTGGGRRQSKKQAKREAKLMLKVEQAKQDVERSERKVSKAQAQLDDSRKQLHDLEEKLAALHAPQQQQTSEQHWSAQMQPGNNQDNTDSNPLMAGQQGQQEQWGEQLPSDETYVGDAVDTERATTPSRAESDVRQSEEQERSQTDAVARDMVQAEDQGVVSMPPDNQEQGSNQGESQMHGQHSNTFFESRSDEEDQASTSKDAEEHPHPAEPPESPEQDAPVPADEQPYTIMEEDKAASSEREPYSSTQQ